MTCGREAPDAMAAPRVLAVSRRPARRPRHEHGFRDIRPLADLPGAQMALNARLPRAARDFHCPGLGLLVLLSGISMGVAAWRFEHRWTVITSLTFAFTLTNGWARAPSPQVRCPCPRTWQAGHQRCAQRAAPCQGGVRARWRSVGG